MWVCAQTPAIYCFRAAIKLNNRMLSFSSTNLKQVLTADTLEQILQANSMDGCCTAAKRAMMDYARYACVLHTT